MSSTVIPFERTDTAFADDLIIKDRDILTEIAGLEPLSAHGLLGLVNLGDTFLAIYFRWRPSLFNDVDPTIREKAPAFAVMLPRSAAPKGSAWDLCLRAQPIRTADTGATTIN